MRIGFVRLSPGALDHERLWGAVGSASLLLAATWARLVGTLPFACPFRSLTGLPCPTCGATRALAALAAGDFGGSLRLNPAVLPASAATAVYALYALAVVAFGLPRIRVHLSAREATVARRATVFAVALFWAFLIVRRA